MKKVHFIGICGKGMAGLAVMLKNQGSIISGSDQGFYDPVYTYLCENNISFEAGHKKENIPADADCIIIGKHAKLVPESNEEVKWAFESGIPIKSFPEIIQELTKNTDNIVVAGSFGKSTCATLLAWCLLEAGQDPSYFIGAVPYGFESSTHSGKDSTFILEGDEYPSANWDPTSKFLYYNPKIILLTSGEHDHLNVFPTLESYLAPFKKLVGLLDDENLIVACLTGAHIDNILEQTQAKIVTYSLENPDADWYAENIHYGIETTFTLVHEGEEITELTTTLLGKHNIENIIGCGALLLEKKLLTPRELQKGIASFMGVKGRLDRKEANASVLVYEGFGSSQAKLASTFEAIRLAYPDKKIIAVFEPHTFSWRNKAALPWYETVFDDADSVLVFEPPAHGKTADQLTLDEIVAKISERKSKVYPFHNSEEGLQKISQITQKDDIILLVTSGDLGGIIPQVPPLVEKLFPLL